MNKLKEWIDTVQCIDCLKGMAQLPDGCVDLVVTDPPYDIQADLLRQIWVEIARIMKADGNLIWTFNTCRLQVIGQTLIPELQEIRAAVWHKPFCPSPWRFGWSWHWEPILWWRKNNGRKGISRYKFSEGDVISVDAIRSTDNQRTNHHDQKPIILWSKLVSWFSSVGDLIFDPFMGSGTTAVAAKQLNRRFIGFEINQKYVDIAKERLRQEILKL